MNNVVGGDVETKNERSAKTESLLECQIGIDTSIDISAVEMHIGLHSQPKGDSEMDLCFALDVRIPLPFCFQTASVKQHQFWKIENALQQLMLQWDSMGGNNFFHEIYKDNHGFLEGRKLSCSGKCVVSVDLHQKDKKEFADILTLTPIQSILNKELERQREELLKCWNESFQFEFEPETHRCEMTIVSSDEE